jgi:carboxyl-terminal processing protease
LVISPIEGTPADRAGLKPQDEIVKVNDKVVVGWQINDVVKLLRGDPGTKVTILVRREGEDQLLDFELVREIIQIKSVRYEKIDDLGYVRIAQFTQRTAQEMEAALSELLPVQGMVLDLRNDPGGLLSAAIEVSDMFLEGGLIVGMRGRVREANEEYYAKSGLLYDGPVIALINEGSASASEIVAGALRDNGRAILVGTKSFGKGSVQTLFHLPDESGLFITIARYYTPAGTEIDKVGLQPDITVEGEMVKEREKDLQLQRAISELRERIASKEALVAR